jgi:hypothetical protein
MIPVSSKRLNSRAVHPNSGIELGMGKSSKKKPMTKKEREERRKRRKEKRSKK